MGARRMDTLSQCARHQASIEVRCLKCGHTAWFSADALKAWLGLGDPAPESIKGFRCRCGSRRHSTPRPERGVDRTKLTKLPPRHPRRPFDAP